MRKKPPKKGHLPFTNTPTSKYFTDDMVEKLLKDYGISTMEQIVPIVDGLKSDDQDFDKLKAYREIVKAVGMNEKDFDAIIEKARPGLTVPRRSARIYPIDPPSK